MDDDALPRKILAGELYYAKVWLVCVALRGVSWDKMPFEQRELAFQAKDAATNCLSNLLHSATYRYDPAPSLLRPPTIHISSRAALRYAVHDSLVTAAFSGLFLLKMANLFPAELDLSAITAQVEQLAQLLSDVAAERYVAPVVTCAVPDDARRTRYALTLRIMLANLRRKIGLASGGATPMSGGPEMMAPPPPFVDPNLVPATAPFTMEELGLTWTSDRPIFSPSAIPLWLQEQVSPSFVRPLRAPLLIATRAQNLTDLGLPVNGSDGIFLQMGNTNGWMGDFPPMPEAW